MSELENQMKFDMELRGYSPLTIKNYILCVKNFAEHYEKSLEQLGENEVRNYLHYCITERKLCEGTVNYMRSAIKFLYTKSLDREWRSEKLRSIKERRKLPVILSQSEIKDLLGATNNLKHRTMLATIYGAGLRISEVAKLKVSDIDSKNMQIIIRNGKGKKDRYSLLSQSNLELLREYWKRYKPDDFLFEGRSSKGHISSRSIQKVFGESKSKAGIKKRATVHSLRHSFATHLLEAGTDICYIQRLMGHRSIQSTVVYLHLRRLDLLSIKSPLDTI